MNEAVAVSAVIGIAWALLFVRLSSVERRLNRLSRLDAKVDALLKHAGITFDEFRDVPADVREAIERGDRSGDRAAAAGNGRRPEGSEGSRRRSPPRGCGRVIHFAGVGATKIVQADMCERRADHAVALEAPPRRRAGCSHWKRSGRGGHPAVGFPAVGKCQVLVGRAMGGASNSSVSVAVLAVCPGSRVLSLDGGSPTHACRANRLSEDVWGAALLAGGLGLFALVLFLGVMNRLVRLPPQPTDDLAHVPS